MIDPVSARAGKRLLIAGWYRPGTGFTRVLQALVDRFATQVEVIWVGVGSEGETRTLAPGITLIPAPAGRGDSVGAYLILEQLHQHRPDAILALNDLWYLEHYARVLGPVLQGTPLIGYLPLDGDIPADLVLPDLRAFRTLCTYTQSAAVDLAAALARNGQAVPVAVVGHGVAQALFKPSAHALASDFSLASRMQAAQALFGLDAPAIVALNASRPDPRKRIDLSLAGIAAYRQQGGRPIKLCLHQAIAHDGIAEALRAQIAELGLSHDILWWPATPGPISDAALAELYNACALGLNTSAGEGFGLVSFEHAACGVPQLLPDLPPLRELWGDAAILLGPPARLPTRWSPLLMSELTPEQVAAGLHAALGDEQRYPTWSRCALSRATAAAFDWDVVAADFKRLLPGVFS